MKMAFALVLFASTALAAQARPSDALASNPVFAKKYAKCHGKTAEGRHFGGPSLLSGKVGVTSEDDLRNIITNGKGRMPKYGTKLSASEINKLVEQIRAAAKQ